MAVVQNIPVGRTEGKDQTPISTINLHLPDPKIVSDVLERGLSMNLKKVKIEWMDCPDLRLYGFVAPGLCGTPALLEIGSLSYFCPTPRLDKKYYFRELLSLLNLTGQDNFIVGAGTHIDPPTYDLAEVLLIFFAGLGGMFMVSGSPTLHHIMPAYSRVTNLYTMKQVQQWLRYRKLIEPVTAVGTIMSEGSYYNNICPNSTELPYLTKSHFHSHTLNQPRSCGGHFYTNCVNTNYLDAFYVGYFSFAEKLYCVDPPSRRDIHTNIDKFYPPCQNHNIGVINIREEYN
ncbi:hypothetical protein DMN91_011510 [Ooceraea biroi]|uniref:DUF1907 domain-containing protein n=1 Tax=Ooceraea biroi TaxID=2015173 RepID=A0A3L8D682_OOCBI|nr:hypothetical protein DMN91_011510 [Ooceraea biroi]